MDSFRYRIHELYYTDALYFIPEATKWSGSLLVELRKLPSSTRLSKLNATIPYSSHNSIQYTGNISSHEEILSEYNLSKPDVKDQYILFDSYRCPVCRGYNPFMVSCDDVVCRCQGYDSIPSTMVLLKAVEMIQMICN